MPSRQPRSRSTSATARSPSASHTARCSASACSTTASTALGPPAGAQARSAGAGRAADRRVPARLPRRRPHARGRQRERRARPRARLERAVPFTNAVMRRLSEGFRELIDSLPEGPLKLSYPDWMAEVWERDLGRDQALALMRAQNEPPETTVRVVRGEIDGEQTDVPGAYPRTARRRSRASQKVESGRRAGARLSPGSRSAPATGNGRSTSARRPAARRRSWQARSLPSRSIPGRARELEENVARLGATNVRVVCADALELPAELDRLRPRARRRAVLRARRAERSDRISAGAPSRCPICSSPSCAQPPSASSPGARSSTPSAR